MRKAHDNRGLTLIELMIVLAIIALVVLAAGEMLSNARKAVGDSQELIRCNAQARAAAALIRSDMHALSKDGFLAVAGRKHTYKLDGEDVTVDLPYLIFTASGTYRSKYGISNTGVHSKANIARIEYGLGLEGSTDDENMIRGLFLYRVARLQLTQPEYDAIDQRWVHKPDLTRGSIAEHFINIQQSRKSIADQIFRYGHFGPAMDLVKVRLPMSRIDDLGGYGLDNMNPTPSYVIGDVQELKIQWGKHNPMQGRIEWYDKDNPFKGDWSDRGPLAQDQNRVADWPEFQDVYRGQRCYAALWTRTKPDNWPQALRLEVTIGKEQERKYEIIMDIPR